MNKFRIGFGFDVHSFASDRPLWLGGIQIMHEKGLLGHSDADVLIHALCDALLGAAGLRDIGFHFPDTSEEFKNIDSKILLKRTMDLLRANSYELGNADITVCAEKPRLSSHIPHIQICLADVMHVDSEDISIKATTSEKMGYVGREEGIAVYASVLIYRKE
ncbi:2-C-methyl-D-erythritol 2,4-cyclodiphosphate synthase [Bacteroidia bacterium]|nr:2-C-methyl-D-erythritol 2,4-cyclodiphosphate synthase [Bacteroidia bacterium]GHT85998.1 2-C-methyl-D-erythritol 2,4-cyclodiphosphate synthase [Bacteroidia bacterium]